MYNLLIVDDEKRVREGLKKLIDWNKMGFKVIDDVESAEKALKIIEENQVSVVLTDIVMPQTDGLELIKSIKDLNSDIKTVILSGYGEFQYAQNAMRLGVFDYLTKPVDFDDIRRIFTNIKLVIDEEIKTAVKEKEYLDSISDNLKATETLEDKSPGLIINNTKQYVNEHFGEGITLGKISEKLYVHPNYLSKLFKEKTGEHFIDYLTKIRIEKSKEFLKDPALRIYEISEITGFCNSKYFGSTFKELVGITPKQYRNQIK